MTTTAAPIGPEAVPGGDDPGVATSHNSPTTRAAAQPRVVLPNGIGMAQLGPSKNTRGERRIRMWLVRRGVPHRLHPRIPGKPRRSADVLVDGDLYVFVHGRFWHDPGGPSRKLSGRWVSLVARNQARDADTQAHLASNGLRYTVIWDDRLSEGKAELLRLLGERGTGPLPGPGVAPPPSSSGTRSH